MKRVIDYLKSLMLLELAAGLWVTLKYLFKPKYTVLFPMETIQERCIACKLCEAVCPALAITIDSAPRASDGQRRTTRYDIDLFKCIYCGFCEESCPVDSIVLTDILEYHMERRGENIITKPQLLAMGDRFEKSIAANRAQDAAYR